MLKNSEQWCLTLYGRRDPSRWPRGTLYPQKLALTSPTCCGRSVGIVCSRTQAMEFSSMGFAGYVSLCMQLYCVGFHCLSLHVSAYMAIFMSVGYFIFICLKDSALLLFFCLFFTWSHCKFPSVGFVKYEVLLFVVYAIFGAVICVFFFCIIKLHADGNITCKTNWTIQCRRMLKYSIMEFSLRFLALNEPVQPEKEKRLLKYLKVGCLH
jgi:hypothetical protein